MACCQWNLNWNSYIFIQACIWNVIWKMATILPWPQNVNSLRASDAYMCRIFHHHWFRWWLVTWSAPSHYLNQCWNIVNWSITNKLQWNFNCKYYIFIQENAFKNVGCEMSAILSQPQCVKKPGYSTQRQQRMPSVHTVFLSSVCQLSQPFPWQPIGFRAINTRGLYFISTLW